MILRPAEPRDALGLARVHVRSWQAAYRGLIADEYLDRLRAEDRAARYDFSHVDPLKPHTTVAIEGDKVCGFVTVGPARDAAMKNFGELLALYVDPDRWKRGVGGALVRAGRERLMEQGYRNAYLWLLSGNLRAGRFYVRDRWIRDGTQRMEVVWGVLLEEERFRRKLA
ncbi:MAG: GNAT family N-acetyltransferase [Acidobacteriota bacterium]|nr:GNAT family N-acetyltransferase [Acidobacteriota bacterium]MDE3164109.1 GNAT family N-acetyltransferase [Acidobacteriota bacterium]